MYWILAPRVATIGQEQAHCPSSCYGCLGISIKYIDIVGDIIISIILLGLLG